MEPLAGMVKVLGTPNITPHLKQTIIDGVLHEALVAPSLNCARRTAR